MSPPTQDPQHGKPQRVSTGNMCTASVPPRFFNSVVLAVLREKTPTALFFKYNSQLGPPYQVLVDTNFINFSIKNKVGQPRGAVPGDLFGEHCCAVPRRGLRFP